MAAFPLSLRRIRPLGAIALLAAAACSHPRPTAPNGAYVRAEAAPDPPAPKPVVVEVPPPAPFPGQLKPVPPRAGSAAATKALKVVAPQQIVMDANHKASQSPAETDYFNAIVQYAFDPGTLYQVFAAPMHITDVVLEPGEKILGQPASGDVVRWILAVGKSIDQGTERAHVYLKPTRPDLQTNLAINTDRRTYLLELHSYADTYMAAVQWHYPQDEMARLQTQAGEAAVQERSAAPIVALDALNFNYAIHVAHGSPAWTPVQVFDDGRRTFIRFPQTMLVREAPALFVLRDNQDAARQLPDEGRLLRHRSADRLRRAARRPARPRDRARRADVRAPAMTPTSEPALGPEPFAVPATDLASDEPGVLDPPLDPHASKISPDDPRLRLARASARTLRKGPAIAAATLVAGSLATATVVALQSAPSHAGSAAADSAAAGPSSPVVPDAVRNPPAVSSAAARSHAMRLPGLDAGPLEGRGEPPPPAGGVRDRRRELALEQADRAQGAGILFDTHEPIGERTPPPSATGIPPYLASAPAPASAPPGAPSDDDPNKQQRKNDFLEGRGAGASPETLGAGIQHPRSPYELQAGSIIPAVLLTAINSDLPGPVIAQVRENVYDSVSGNTLLVPQGARMLANYDSMVVWGQQRVLVCWQRLLFPNGDSVSLHCMPAADLEGAAGLTDQVDEHWWRLLAGAGISSLLAATAQGVAGNQAGYAPTVPQLWANNGAQSVNQTGQQIVRRDMMVAPTITVRPGFSVNLIVNKDMILAPYKEGASPPAAAP